MLFSYNWLQTFFEKKLPEPKVLADLIIRHGFEVEFMEKKGKDTIFDLAILSNRPDCFSHIGIAREISAILGCKLILPKTKFKSQKAAPATKSLVNVAIAEPEACLRYSARVVLGVKVGPSPDWMRQRLEACGLRSINNVVDATNYVMLEMGQPLHAFDWDKLENRQSNSPRANKAKKIIVRYAAKDETIEILGGKQYKLAADTLVIADETGALAIGGIKGGKRAEIDDKTTTIIIESANFNSRAIRIASRNLGLQTEASLLFGHSPDYSQTGAAADRAAALIAQITPAAAGEPRPAQLGEVRRLRLDGRGSVQIAAGALDAGLPAAKAKKITLKLDRVENLLGCDVQTARIKKILEPLGFSVRKGNGSIMDVAVPSRRIDISAPEDLIEEIGRIGGYDKIVAKAPVGPVAAPEKNYFWHWKNTIKDALAARGWTETRNYSFVSPRDCENFGFNLKNSLEIKNPVNADMAFMRPSLLVNIAKNIAKNPDCAALRQFEVGKIFGVNLRMEPTMLAGIARGTSFFEAKGALEFVCQRLGLANFKCVPLGEKMDSLFDAGRSARIFANGREAGILGRISSSISARLGLEDAIVFELSVDVLAAMATELIEYRPISTHPRAVRDLAILAPREVLAQTIIDAMQKAAGHLARSIAPVDVYQGDKIAAGLKNIVFRITYQANDRTLSGNEIDKMQADIIKAVETCGWQVRK